ncbi:hypothetical protein C5167_027541 [Papaver somniferum]|nr:hypothetical protein C5167_027541 [Papaver somniferum]
MRICDLQDQFTKKWVRVVQWSFGSQNTKPLAMHLWISRYDSHTPKWDIDNAFEYCTIQGTKDLFTANATVRLAPEEEDFLRYKFRNVSATARVSY